MKKLIIAFAALIVLVVVFGCADDIILPKDQPLNGDYYGTYTIIQDFGGADEQTFQNHVSWTFTETRYIMKVDTDSIETNQECFCNANGQYSLTDGVRLKELKSQPAGGVAECNACNFDYTPTGIFQRQLQEGTLILRSLDNANNIFHELRLTRVEEEEE
jgi:hypothetical protein